MIESLENPQKHDRLTAFLKAFALTATHCGSVETANLLIIANESAGRPTHLLYRARTAGPLPDGATLHAAAQIDFGSTINPLIGALPDELCLPLSESPQLLALAELIVDEAEISRCGGRTIQSRLCEVIVVLAIRKAIAIGTVNAGLLAGLAHPRLHMSLVALHDDPARDWRIADLAAIAGLSRSQFIGIFKRTVGETPNAYLSAWRLTLGRAELQAGRSVKAAASLVGFGSATSFSRAFSRKYGLPPTLSKSA